MFLTAKFSRLDLGSIARMMGLPDFLANSSLPQVIVKAMSGNRLLVNKANEVLSERGAGITISDITMPDPLTVSVDVEKIDHAAVLTQVCAMAPDAVRKNPQYAAIFGVLDSGDCSKRLIKGICGSLSTEELDRLVAALMEAFRPGLINAINKTCREKHIDAVVTDILIDAENKQTKQQTSDVIYL
jgi:hypothetical protein